MFLDEALPINGEWKIKPYFGVLPFVFNALNNAFSAPRIWTVDAGYFARLVNEPACEIKRAPTKSPMSACKFGATCVDKREEKHDVSVIVMTMMMLKILEKV